MEQCPRLFPQSTKTTVYRGRSGGKRRRQSGDASHTTRNGALKKPRRNSDADWQRCRLFAPSPLSSGLELQRHHRKNAGWSRSVSVSVSAGRLWPPTYVVVIQCQMSDFRWKQESQSPLQHSNTPTLQHSNTPTLQHSNTPTLQHSNTPTLQYSNTPTLQYSNTPTLQYSNTPILQYSAPPNDVYQRSVFVSISLPRCSE